MILPRIHMFGFSGGTIGETLKHLSDFPFEIRLFSFKKSEQIKNWLSKIDKADLADFYLIDCWTLFVSRFGSPHSLKDFPNIGKLQEFMSDNILPLKKEFERIVYHPEFITLIFYAAGKYLQFARVLYGVYAGTYRTPYYDEFVPSDLDFGPRLEQIKGMKILDPEKREGILNQVLVELQMSNLRGHPASKLIDPTLRIIDKPSVIDRFKERCKKFLFLCSLYKKHEGNVKTIERNSRDKLNGMCDISSLEAEHKICLSKCPETSRHDFQILYLLDTLFPDPNDSKRFVQFLGNLKELMKPQPETRKRPSAELFR